MGTCNLDRNNANMRHNNRRKGRKKKKHICNSNEQMVMHNVQGTMQRKQLTLAMETRQRKMVQPKRPTRLTKRKKHATMQVENTHLLFLNKN